MKLKMGFSFHTQCIYKRHNHLERYLVQGLLNFISICACAALTDAINYRQCLNIPQLRKRMRRNCNQCINNMLGKRQLCMAGVRYVISNCLRFNKIKIVINVFTVYTSCTFMYMGKHMCMCWSVKNVYMCMYSTCTQTLSRTSMHIQLHMCMCVHLYTYRYTYMYFTCSYSSVHSTEHDT